MALITALLFGLLGATPVFMFAKMELSSVVAGFVVITSVTLVFWTVNIGLFLLSNWLHLEEKDWVRYIASAAFCAILFVITIQFIPFKRPEMPAAFPKDFHDPSLRQSFRWLMPLIQAQSINLVTIVLLEMLLLKDKKRKVEDENSRLRVINLEAKHSHLKQQLHPHFLFNSLSTLRSLIKRSPIQAEEYLVKLSEILRFSINSGEQALIAVGQELELTRNYLNMQQVRFGSALNFTIAIPAEMLYNGRVPVYSIQLLVENAIKHNILTTEQPLYIVIKGNYEINELSIENNFQPKLQITEGQGVGLSNLSERYILLNNEKVIITKSDEKFIVTIKVLKDESSNH